MNGCVLISKNINYDLTLLKHALHDNNGIQPPLQYYAAGTMHCTGSFDTICEP